MFQKHKNHKNLLVFIRSVLDHKFPLILSVSATWAGAKACQSKKKKKKIKAWADHLDASSYGWTFS